MHDELNCAACGNFSGNPYWLQYAALLLLLTWGALAQRRDDLKPRFLLRIGMGLGAGSTILMFGSQFLPLAYMNEPALRVTMYPAAFTIGCIYLELVLSPRRERIPHAIARERS